MRTGNRTPTKKANQATKAHTMTSHRGAMGTGNHQKWANKRPGMTTLALTQGNKATDGKVLLTRPKRTTRPPTGNKRGALHKQAIKPQVAEKTGGSRVGARYMDIPTQPILYDNKERTAPRGRGQQH